MRNVRPSWVSVSIDGRKGTIEGGPRSRSGALSALFSARIDGTAVPFLTVEAVLSADGRTVVWTVREVGATDESIVFRRTVAQ